MNSTDATARDLRDVLRPLVRRMNAERTISMGKLGILGYLADSGPATASTLAVAERISPQAVTMAVRELEVLALVERTPDTADRRRVWIALTAAGRERLGQERAVGHGWLRAALLERLSPAEMDIVHAAIPVLAKLAPDAGNAQATHLG